MLQFLYVTTQSVRLYLITLSQEKKTIGLELCLVKS